MKNRTGKDLPLLEEFRTFLKDQADLIDSVEKQRPERYPAKVTYHRQTSRALTSKIMPCVICEESHAIHQCVEFKDLDVLSRSQRVKSLSLCFNCLRKGHSLQVQNYHNLLQMQM